MKNTLKFLLRRTFAAFPAFLVAFGLVGSAWGALSGSGTSADPYQIGTLADLQEFRDAVNGGNSYADQYVQLTADIDLSSVADWTPIGEGTRKGVGNCFAGTFDGNGKSISGLTITSYSKGTDYAVGLFGLVKGGTVKDFTMTAVSIAVGGSQYAVGSAVGAVYGSGMVSGVSVTSGSVTGGKGVGGVVGMVTNGGTVSGCSNAATVNAQTYNAGGVVGSAYCTTATTAPAVVNCANSGSVSGSTVVGGVVGLSSADVSGCSNTASVTGNDTSVGGVIGEQKSYGTVSGNSNSGTVTNNKSDGYGNGGIIGWIRYQNDSSYVQCTRVSVLNNTNTGSVSGGNDAGGIVGTVYHTALVSGNTNKAATLSGTRFAAGIVGNYQIGNVGAAYEPADNTDVITISGNTSETAAANITANLTSNIVYDNTQGANSIIVNNTPSNQDRAVVASVTVNGVTTAYATLQEALSVAATAHANATVDVLTDIDLTGNTWTPVSIDANKGGMFVTVNGANHTITGLNECLFSSTWAGNTGLAINDLTIKDSNIVHDQNDASGDQGVGAFIGWPQASATITLSNCHLVDSTVEGGHWTGGLIGIASGYSGNDGPVFEIVTITGCSVENSTIKGKGSVGGIIGHGAASAWTQVVITNTTVSGNTVTSTGSSNNKAGSVLGTIGAAGQATEVSGVTHTGGIAVDATVADNTVSSGGQATDSIFGRVGSNGGELAVTGGTYDGTATYANDTYDSSNGKIAISGGSFKTVPSSDAMADGFMMEGTPNAQGFYEVTVDPYAAYTKVADGFYQSAATYTASTDFYITSKAGLEYFRDLVNQVGTVTDTYISTYVTDKTTTTWYQEGVFGDKTVHLLADIDLNNEEWSPIGQPKNAAGDKRYFYGHFNGENHTISNLKATTYVETIKTWYPGLFGFIGSKAGQTFSNLTINNVTLVGYDYAGAIVGNAGSNPTAFNNCHVTGNIDIKCTMTGAFVGGIVGIGTSAITDCSVEGSAGSTIEGSTVGGLAGTSTRSANASANTVAGSTVTGVTVNSEDNGGQAGGLVGKATNPVTVTGNTVHDVTVSAENGKADALVGGVGGDVTASSNTTDTNVTVISDPITGSGTQADPYIIANIDALKAFRDRVNAGNTYAGKVFKLTADIDLNNEEWEPIGLFSYRATSNNSGSAVVLKKPFCGTFDGDNHTISNLKMSVTKGGKAYQGAGLFGYTTDTAVIKNLNLHNADVQGRLYVGTIVGYGYTGNMIDNCHVSGVIKVEGSWYLGGLGGNGYMSKITNCSVIGDAGSGSYVRGLGNDTEGIYGDGTSGYVGGIWGFRGEGANVIANCTVQNISVEGQWNGTGGIVGIAHYGNIISNCTVEAMTVSASEDDNNCGLIAGSDLSKASEPAKVIDCTVSDGATASAGTGAAQRPVTTQLGAANNNGVLTTPENSALVGSDVVYDESGKITGGTFEKVPDSTLAEGYGPVANAQGLYTVEALPLIATVTAGGTTKNYYDLHKALEAGKADGSVVTLQADVDLAGVAWEPVGTAADKFQGAIDGNGKVISNLTINDPTLDYAGLIGYGNGGTSAQVIKDLTISNATITARMYVGVLGGCLYANNSINNVTVKGLIQVTGNYMVGGVVGQSYIHAYDSAIVGDEGSFVKGLYLGGKNEVVDGMTLPDDCEGDNVGGFIGHMGEGSGIGLYNCSASGLTVMGSRKVGGLVGTLPPENTLENVNVHDITVGTTATAEYATAKKSSMEIGGIVGSYYNNGTGGVISGTVQDITIAELPAGITGSGEGKNISYGLVTGGNRGSDPASKLTYSGLIAKGYDAAKYNNSYLINNYVAVVKDANGDFVGGYATLQEALDAASAGATIVLCANIDEDVILATAEKKNMTLDFDGSTLTGQIQAKYGKSIDGLLVKNGTLIGRNTSNWKSFLSYGSSGGVTFEDMTITSVLTSGIAISNSSGAKYTLKNCTVNGKITSGGSGCTTEIVSGTYTSTFGTALFEATQGLIAIHGGVFSTTGSSMFSISNKGVIEVDGGTFYLDPSTYVVEGLAAQQGMDANEVVCWTIVEGPDVVTVTLEDGTVTKYKKLMPALEAAAAAGQKATVEVAAGKYTIDSAVTIPEGLTLKGAGAAATTFKIASANGDGIKIAQPNVTISNATIDGSAITSGGYKSLVNVTADGVVIDSVVMTGGGSSTWNSSILVEQLTSAQTFTVRNSTISGSFRGVLRESCSGNIVIDNCDIDAVYPFNIDGGNGGTVTVTDSSLHGWSSYSSVDSVTFTNCEFTKGNSGYDYVVAYSDTVFNNCSFDAEFSMEKSSDNPTMQLTDCTKDGTALTWTNIKDVFTDPDAATLWTNGDCFVNSTNVNSDARIGDRYYVLTDAIAAAQEGDTVTLIADVTVNTQINLPVPMTIDLGGKTITSAADNRVFKIATAVGEYTFKNGTVNTTNPCYGLFRVDNASTVTVEGITATNNRSGGCNFRIAGAAQVLVTNCTITATNGGGIYAEGGSTVNVYDSTIAETGTATDCNASAFAVGEGATITVHSGTYSGEYGAFVCSSGGTIEILDGSVTGRRYALESDARAGGNEDNSIADSLIKVSGGTIDGELHEEIQIYNSATLTYANKMQISGGTFRNYSATGPTADNAGYEISGGWFDHQVLAAHCAEGYVPTTTADTETGLYTVTSEYDAQIVRSGSIVQRGTLAAMAAAAQAGDTIQVLRDVANAGALTLPANATLESYASEKFALSGEVSITLDPAGGTVQNIDFSDVKPSRGTIESVISATPAAGAVFTITGNTFTTPGAVKQILIEAADATDFTATISGNAFNAGSRTKRAFAVVNAADADKLTLSGNYIADGLWFGASADGANVSEDAYPQLASADAEEATVALPTFIVKKNATDSKPAIFGYATLAAAFDGAATGDTILMTADASIDAPVQTAKALTIDGQNHTLAATDSWALKGISQTLNGDTTTGSVTLQDMALVCGAGDYSTARLEKVTIGSDVVIDATAVTGFTLEAMSVAAGTTLAVDSAKVQREQQLLGTVSALADVEVTGLAATTYLVLEDGYVTVKQYAATDGTNYYKTLDDAVAAADAAVAGGGDDLSITIIDDRLDTAPANWVISGTSLLRGVAKIGDTYYLTLADAVSAAVDGDTIELIRDAELTSTVEKLTPTSFDITIDGKGHTVKPATGFSGYSAFLLGDTHATSLGDQAYTITNTVFSGFNTPYGVLRVQGATATIADCTFADNTATSESFSIVNSNYAAVTVDGCVFEDNESACATIDIGNMMGDSGTATGEATVIKNSLFTGNTSAVAEVFIGIGQGKTTVDSNTFSQNTDGIAVVYASNSADITGNLFDRNAITGTGVNMVTVLAGPYGYDGEREVNITGNAFVDNTSDNGSTANVYLEDYSSSGTETAYDIRGNYWDDGEAPVAGVDYVAQCEADATTYATTYTPNPEGTGVDVTQSADAAIAAIVRNGSIVAYYWTLQDAITAAQDGDTIKLLADIEVASMIQLNKEGTFVIDGNGHTISKAAGATFDGNGILIFGPAGVGSGYDVAANIASKKYTLKNATITDFTAEIIRCEGCSLTLDGCTFTENAITETLGRGKHLLRLSQSAVEVKGCTFSDNASDGNGIYFESGDDTAATLTVTDSLFTGNTINGNGLVLVATAAGASDAITGNTFTENTVSGTGNVAILYLSAPVENVSGNLLSNNTVTTTGASSKEGVVVLGSGASGTAVTNNAFVYNTLGTTATKYATVWVNDNSSAYTYDVSGNYWGDGQVPETGSGMDIYATASGTMKADTYATSYSANAEGNGASVATTAAPAYNVWVGGVQITSVNAGDVFSNGKVSYNDATKTLTLNGYSYSGAGHENSAVYATDDIAIVVKGENSLTSTAGNGIYAGGAIAVTGQGTNPTLNVTAESNSYALQVAGASAAFTNVTMAVSGNRGFVVNQNNVPSDSIDIKNCTITFASGTDRALQVWNGAGDSALTIADSTVTGVGHILMFADGDTGDTTCFITNSTVSLTASQIESYNGDATVEISESTVSMTGGANNKNGAFNVGARYGADTTASVKIVNNSNVTCSGQLSGVNVWTWGENVTQASEIIVEDSTFTSSGYYYGMSAYSIYEGDTTVYFTNSTVNATGMVSGIEMCSDASYNAIGDKTYVQLDSDVTLNSTSYPYGLDLDNHTSGGVNDDASATATIIGGSLTCNGGGLYVVGDDDNNSAVTMHDTEVTIDLTDRDWYPIVTGALNIDSGTYTINDPANNGIAVDVGNISGGKFNFEVPEELCADGYIPREGVIETINGVDYYTVKQGAYVAAVYDANDDLVGKYETLAAAAAAAPANSTITLLADVANTGDIHLKSGVTLDGDRHGISGDSAIRLNAAGGTVTDTVFTNIHNSASQKSAIYASNLSGEATITECVFENCDWDAIQMTPVANAKIVITDNVFSDDNEDGIRQQRFVHIQSAKNVDFKATVTDNVMRGETAQEALEVYYFADAEDVKLSGNYIEYPNKVCILSGSGTNVGELAWPQRSEPDVNTDDLTAVAAIKGTYTSQFFPTLAEAIAAAQSGDTITLLADITTPEAMSATDSRFNYWINKDITLDGDGHTLNVSGRGFGIQGASENIDVVFKNITINNVGNVNGRCIDTRGNIASLTLDGATLSTATSSYTGWLQPLTIGGNQSSAAIVTITNSTIVTSTDGDKGYAITTFNPVNMTIENSTVKGWACLNIKGPDNSAGSSGSVINIDDCTLVSKNVYSGQSNSYGAIKLEDVDIEINITNTEILIDGANNSQAIASFESGSLSDIDINLGEGNSVTFANEGDFAHNNSDTAQLLVSGGTFNKPVPEDVCAPGYIPAPQDPETGLYTVKSGYYVAQIVRSDDIVAKYEELGDAINAAQANDTVEVLTNCTLSAGVVIEKNLTITGPVDAAGNPRFTVTGAVDRTSLTKPNYGDILVTDDLDKPVAVTISHLAFYGFGTAATLVENDIASVITFETYEDASTLTLTNLAFTAYNDFAVAMFGGGLLEVQDCAIDGEASQGKGGVYFEDGWATVVESSISNVAEGIVASYADVAITNATISTINVANAVAVGSYDDSYVTIDGGSYAGALVEDNYGEFEVSSGLFDRYVDEGYCTPGKVSIPVADPAGWFEVTEGTLVAKVTHDGADTLYASLAAAIAAADTGDTVTLFHDATADATKTTADDRIVVTKAITIDFGEYTYSVPGSLEPTANWAALYIDANTVVTGTTGGIDCLDKENNGGCGVYAFNVRNGAKLTINGGSYHGGGTVIQAQLGTVEINGGTFTATAFDAPYGTDFFLNCVDSAYAAGTAGFSIQGGTFVGFDPQDNKADGEHTDYTATGYVAIEDENNRGTFVVQPGWKVTFDADGGAPAPAAQRVKDGEKATEPTIPMLDGQAFQGWFAAGATAAFDFDDAPASDLALTAQWADAAATVITITDGGATTNVVGVYATLAEAVENAPTGATIVLADDVALTSTVEIDKDLVIDLNGNDIAATNARALWIKAGDVELTGAGEISATGDGLDPQSSVIRVGDNAANANLAKLTIGEGVTVTSDKCYGVTTFGKNAAGIVLVVDGTVDVSSTGKADAAISGNGNSDLAAVTTTINGKVIKTNGGAAIYQPGAGTLTINDGAEVTGPTAVYVKSGTVNVEGGTLTGTGAKADYAPSGDGLNATGDALVIDNCGYPKGAPSASITGGTFISDYAQSVGSYATTGRDPIDGFIDPTGDALFSDADADGVPEGYALFEAGNGLYAVAKAWTIRWIVQGETDPLQTVVVSNGTAAADIKALAPTAVTAPEGKAFNGDWSPAYAAASADADYVAQFVDYSQISLGGLVFTSFEQTGETTWKADFVFDNFSVASAAVEGSAFKALATTTLGETPAAVENSTVTLDLNEKSGTVTINLGNDAPTSFFLVGLSGGAPAPSGD